MVKVEGGMAGVPVCVEGWLGCLCLCGARGELLTLPKDIPGISAATSSAPAAAGFPPSVHYIFVFVPTM